LELDKIKQKKSEKKVTTTTIVTTVSGKHGSTSTTIRVYENFSVLRT